MEKFTSHFSAVIHWNIPYIETVLGADLAKKSLAEFTVFQSKFLSQQRGQISHLCQLPLPAGAVVSLNGKLIASPELIFLELALKLDIHRLILLGLQLCSHPPGKPNEAITTKEKLEIFLAKTPGYHGRIKALRAIKYIRDGSASVMESIAYMILTLPHSLGGYGLNGAVFNHEIRLKEAASKRLGQNRCFADLYYKPAKLAVEYESFAFHSSPQEQGKDIMRAAILARHGIEVMRLSTIQLYDKDACMDFAFNLASRLRKRIHIRTEKFDEMHELLRALLPLGGSIIG